MFRSVGLRDWERTYRVGDSVRASGTETNKAVVACVPRASLVWRVPDSHVLTQSALSTSCFAPSS